MPLPQPIVDQAGVVQASFEALSNARTTAANSAATAATANTQAATDAAAVTQAETQLNADLAALIALENQTWSPAATKGLRSLPGKAGPTK